MARHDTIREDTVPMLVIGEDTEPIVIDTTRRRRRFPVATMPAIAPEPIPPRPRWADGVVPKRRQR